MVLADWLRRHRRRLLGNLGFFLLLAVVFFGVRHYQQRTLIEGPAPALAARLLDGAAFELATDRTRPTLVYFWATWCPVCKLEQGAIDALARDARVVTIAMQSGDDATLTAYLRENNLQYPVINDPHGDHATAWGVRATPTFFFVDPDGQIHSREIGYTTETGLRLRLWLAQ